jgi:hypothetical protein
MILFATLAASCAGLVYAGYLNQILKGQVEGHHRLVLILGFMVGVYASARFSFAWIARSLRKRRD